MVALVTGRWWNGMSCHAAWSANFSWLLTMAGLFPLSYTMVFFADIMNSI